LVDLIWAVWRFGGSDLGFGGSDLGFGGSDLGFGGSDLGFGGSPWTVSRTRSG
jgi:hypothetical protein